MSTLKQRIFHAGAWTVSGHVLRQAIRLGSSLVMTRLLVPEMFGVMAIANVLIIGLSLFSDIGLQQKIIQGERGEDAAFQDTAWVLQIARGAVIWFLGLCLSAALFIAGGVGWLRTGTAYADPVLPWVVFVLSFTALVAGFQSTKLAIASRRLTLGRITLIDLGSQIAGLLVMLVWVLLDRSIWALVAGGIAATLVKTLLSHIALEGAPNRFRWDRESLGEFAGFGKWVFVSSIVGFLVDNGDRLLLGAVVTTEVLGIYSIAYLIFNSIRWGILNLAINVSFPALSEVCRDRPSDLHTSYYKFRMLFDAPTMFVSGFLFVAGDLAVKLLYDARYGEAGWMLRVLAVALIATQYSVSEQCYLAQAKPRLLFLLNLTRASALYLLVPVAYAAYQLDGALWAIALSYFAGLPILFYFKWKDGLWKPKYELGVFAVFLFGMLAGNVAAIVAHWF